MVNYIYFVLCSKRTKPTERRSINKGIKKYFRHKFLIQVPDNSFMRNKSRHIYRNESAICTCNQSDTCTVSTSDQQKSLPPVSLSLASTAKTHAYCCICKQEAHGPHRSPEKNSSNQFFFH